MPSAKQFKSPKRFEIEWFGFSFEPLEVFSPAPDYKMDETELQKSIDKSHSLGRPSHSDIVQLGFAERR